MLPILIITVEENPENQLGTIAKATLKYFLDTIHPKAFYIQFLASSINVTYYNKIMAIYELDPKDFIKVDPNSL